MEFKFRVNVYVRNSKAENKGKTYDKMTLNQPQFPPNFTKNWHYLFKLLY